MAATHDECELSSEEEEILPDIYSSSEENLEGELDALCYIKKAVRARILQRRIDKVRYYRCNK